jgi:DNA-binding transcriptional ArsR family regulator
VNAPIFDALAPAAALEVESELWQGFCAVSRSSLTARSRTYSHVAMQNAAALDRTFRALADRTRRSMIHALATGEARSAGELGKQFRSAQPTISRHLKVLERAKLIERSIDGRVHRFRLRQRGLAEVGTWIARHQQFWTGAVDQLDQLLQDRAR